jgi:hypothetical protein
VSIEISHPLFVRILRSCPARLRLNDEKAESRTVLGGRVKEVGRLDDLNALLNVMNFSTSSTDGVGVAIPGELTPLPEHPRPDALESKVTLCP